MQQHLLAQHFFGFSSCWNFQPQKKWNEKKSPTTSASRYLGITSGDLLADNWNSISIYPSVSWIVYLVADCFFTKHLKRTTSGFCPRFFMTFLWLLRLCDVSCRLFAIKIWFLLWGKSGFQKRNGWNAWKILEGQRETFCSGGSSFACSLWRVWKKLKA